MLKIQNLDYSCTGCSACANICPYSAISIGENSEGFYSPFVNTTLCKDCGCCEKVCPALNEKNINRNDWSPYMFKSSSKEVLASSSSGGAFFTLADFILQKGGVVFGAKYNYVNNRLEHASSDHCDISELMGSKYIESYIGESYKSVKEHILNGRYTMFVGSPCQVAGLRNYLGRLALNPKLLIVDFVCHGVPSNSHFTQYVKWLEKKNKSKLVRYDFRTKVNGWRGSTIYSEYSNGLKIYTPFIKSYYNYAFNHNWILRRSCYECKILNSHLSDITIGDFWGITSIDKYKDDSEGISILISNSSKGSDLLKYIQPGNFLLSVDKKYVKYIYDERQNNHAYKSLVNKRDALVSMINIKGFIPVIRHEYWKKCFWMRFKMYIKDILIQWGIWGTT